MNLRSMYSLEKRKREHELGRAGRRRASESSSFISGNRGIKRGEEGMNHPNLQRHAPNTELEAPAKAPASPVLPAIWLKHRENVMQESQRANQ